MNIHEKYRKAHEKALAGEASPRQAIKAKCLDCCCWQSSEVADCMAKQCPLYKYRPEYRSS